MKTDVQKKVEQFFRQFPLQNVSKGEIMLHPEDNPSVAYYLQSGHIREYGVSTQGVEVTIHIYNPYSFFPMTWILSDIPNRYYFEALTDVQVHTAPKDKVIAFLKKNPDVLLDLSQRIFKAVDKLTSRIENLAFGKAYTRVISTLIYLARHFGDSSDNTVTLNQKFTHREIASLAGISRETASREWEKLQKQELITYNDQFIVINNLQDLETLVSDIG